MHSGEEVEIDEEMYYYWLEVLPPVYIGFPEKSTPPEVQLRLCRGRGADYLVLENRNTVLLSAIQHYEPLLVRAIMLKLRQRQPYLGKTLVAYHEW